MGLSGPFESYRPMSASDHCGYEIAIGMVFASRAPGRYGTKYLQFEIVRKL